MIQDYRNLFNTAHSSENDCKKLLELSINDDTALGRAYFYSASMMNTRFIHNPFKKMSEFNNFKNKFEDLISENFETVELHFIRYTIQKNIPKFIGYYKNIDADRKIVIDFLINGTDSELKKHCMVYFTNMPDLDPTERNKISV